jgi:flagellum-specific peptidoglycan hydrolase FlgJ
MGFGINLTGAAAGYNAYRDEQRRQEDTERRRVEDEAKKADRAYQDELRSRQRYEWSEADRVRDANKKTAADYWQDPPASDTTAPTTSTPAAPSAAAAPAPAMPSAPAAGGTAPDDGGPQTLPVADPAADITPAPMATASKLATPLVDGLEGPPPQRAIAPDMTAAPAAPAAPIAQAAPAAPIAQAAPAAPIAQAAPTAQVAPTAPASGDVAPLVQQPAGIPKPRDMRSMLGMYETMLNSAAKRGDVNPQAYVQTRELLNKMRTEGVTQAMEAFAHGDFAGGMALYNGLGENRGRIVGTPQQATTTLPNGMEVPTWKLQIANNDGSRTDIDTSLNQFQTMALKDRLEVMDKAAQRKSETDYKTGMVEAARKNADTNAGYREDQAKNMREQRRLQEEALKVKQAQSAEQAANWTKEADAYLVATTKAKDQDGNEVYDGDGFTFAKTVGIDYARQHGGDAMSGAGVAVGVNNQLKALATANVAKAAKDPKAANDPKMLDPVAELRRLRAEYLKHAIRATPQQGDAQPNAQQADYANSYGAAAKRAGEALGVDPSVVLGHWGLETGWGQSIVPGTNNLGNIKDFSGEGVEATDNQTGSVDKYRAFASPDEFADQYVDLIRRKYPGAVGAGADAARFGAALKTGGYAEDPDYAAKVQAAYKTVAARSTPHQGKGGTGPAPQKNAAQTPPRAAAPAATGMTDAALETWVQEKLIGPLDGPAKYQEIAKTNPNPAIRKAAARLYAKAKEQAANAGESASMPL